MLRDQDPFGGDTSGASTVRFRSPAPTRPTLDDTLSATLRWVYALALPGSAFTDVPGIPHLPQLTGPPPRVEPGRQVELAQSRGRIAARDEAPVAKIGAQPWAQLAAAFHVRIEGLAIVDLFDVLELHAAPTQRRDWNDATRLKSAERLVRAGDARWHELGAWPWAAFPADTRPLRWAWWEEDAPADALAAWHHEMRRGLELQAQELADALERDDLGTRPVPMLRPQRS